MSLSLEDRLAAHLRDQVDTELAEPTELPTVRRIAKRRSLRARVAVGLCGLAAIAGLGSLVPRGIEPSALVTAEDPVTPESIAQPDPLLQQHEGPEDTESADLDLSHAAPPQASRIISDGAGGFAAIGATTSTGRTTFVRSDDGLTWRQAGEWQHGAEVFATRMLFTDGHFVVLLDRQRGDLTTSLVHPQLAVSTDLQEWRVIDAPIANAAEVPLFTIHDVALHDGDVAVILTEYGNPIANDDTIWPNDFCGLSTTPTTFSVTLCSGEVVDYPVESELHHQPRQRILQSVGGGPAVEQEFPWWQEAPHEVFVLDGEFAYVRVGAGLDAGLAELFPALDDDDVKPVVLSVENDVAGEAMFLLQVGTELFTAHWPSQTIAPLPDEVEAPRPLTPHQLVSGPSGWALLVDTSPQTLLDVAVQGWTVSGTPSSNIFGLWAADGSERHQYHSFGRGAAPYVQWGLFGNVRLYRPGTDELLVEVPAEPTRRAHQLFTGQHDGLPPTAAFDRQLHQDGWTLEGDPLRGPLLLTAADGTTRTFADGFAFTNGDTSDGVEIELYGGTASFLHYDLPSQPLRFYEDGELMVEFGTDDIHSTLVVPIFDDDELQQGRAIPLMVPTDTQAWLLHSADGADWRIVDEPNASMAHTQIEIILGDEEILVARSNWPTADRIELPTD